MVLEQRALVLNRSWIAIGTTTVRAALCLMHRAAAHAVEPAQGTIHDFDSWSRLSVLDAEPCVRTVRYRLRAPEVLLLARYDAVPRRRISFSRRNVYRRDRFTCQYCGARPSDDALTVDHVIPRSRGGKTTWTNCVVSCARCNRRKSNRTPEESGVRLIHPPQEPTWSPCLTIPHDQRRRSWDPFIPAGLRLQEI